MLFFLLSLGRNELVWEERLDPYDNNNYKGLVAFVQEIRDNLFWQRKIRYLLIIYVILA